MEEAFRTWNDVIFSEDESDSDFSEGEQQNFSTKFEQEQFEGSDGD